MSAAPTTTAQYNSCSSGPGHFTAGQSLINFKLCTFTYKLSDIIKKSNVTDERENGKTTVVLPPSSKADYYAFVPRSAVC